MATKDILIEWQFDECETEGTSVHANSQLSSMTVAEELSEIIRPFCHPIGMVITQVIALGFLYDGFTWFARQHIHLFNENIVFTVIFCACTVFMLAVFVCFKYWRPKHLAWISTLLLSLSAWIITEWSLFLD